MNWQTIIVIIGSGVNVFAIIILASRIKIAPEKREITFAEQFAKKEELKAVSRRIDAIEGKLDQHYRELREAGDQRRDAILRKQHDDVSNLHNRLDRVAEEMPQRIITLLQTTGALKR